MARLNDYQKRMRDQIAAGHQFYGSNVALHLDIENGEPVLIFDAFDCDNLARMGGDYFGNEVIDAAFNVVRKRTKKSRRKFMRNDITKTQEADADAEYLLDHCWRVSYGVVADNAVVHTGEIVIRQRDLLNPPEGGCEVTWTDLLQAVDDELNASKRLPRRQSIYFVSATEEIDRDSK